MFKIFSRNLKRDRISEPQFWATVRDCLKLLIRRAAVKNFRKFSLMGILVSVNL